MIRNRDNFFLSRPRRKPGVLNLFIAAMLLLVMGQPAFAQTNGEYEDISLTLNVQRIGNTEMPALIRNQEVFLPIKDLFDYLKIRNIPNTTLDTIEGFYIQPQATYFVDKPNSRITYGDKVYEVPASDLLLTETNLYLKTDWFKTIFELDAVFNFRSLSVTLTSKVDLPAIREMQQEVLRKNIVKLKGERKADSTINREYSLFRMGVADWSITATKEANGKINTRASFALGTNIAGGQADVYMNFNTNKQLFRNTQYFRWRYVNNQNRFLKQVTLGRVNSSLVSSVFGPMIGVQFSNTPTTYRRSFGTFTLSNTTEPGWMVELYVNNVLVNYMQADASGFFSFEVPMVYGNSTVKLRFFGPWGEERTREQIVTVPFNFLPGGQWEYNVTAGYVDEVDRKKITRAVTSFGVSNRLTIGAGIEYLTSHAETNTIPFVSASARLTSNMMVGGEHAVDVRDKAVFTYRLPSNLQFDMEYIRYAEGQTAIKNNYISEKKAIVSMPLRGKKFSTFNRLTVSQVRVPKTNFTTAEMLVSAIVKGVSANLTTNAYITDPRHPYFFTNLSLNFRQKSGIRITPQVQFDFRSNRFSQLKLEAEKNLFNKGYANASYERNMVARSGFFTLGVRYNFSFAQVAMTARQVNKDVSLVQTAHGSLLFDDQTKFTSASSIDNVGKGAIILAPFLDVNCNGIRDKGEKKVDGLNIHVAGGRMQRLKDSSIAILGLEAYTNCFIELDKNSFENIAWQLNKKTLSVAVNANMFKKIDIPIMVMGEVAGTVYLDNQKGKNGLSRVIVNLFAEDGRQVGRALTEADGYFTYLGLAPGRYYATVDSEQMKKLNLSTKSLHQSFTIKQTQEGDFVEGIDFVLGEEKASQ